MLSAEAVSESWYATGGDTLPPGNGCRMSLAGEIVLTGSIVGMSDGTLRSFEERVPPARLSKSVLLMWALSEV